MNRIPSKLFVARRQALPGSWGSGGGTRWKRPLHTGRWRSVERIGDLTNQNGDITESTNKKWWCNGDIYIYIVNIVNIVRYCNLSRWFVVMGCCRIVQAPLLVPTVWISDGNCLQRSTSHAGIGSGVKLAIPQINVAMQSDETCPNLVVDLPPPIGYGKHFEHVQDF